MKKVLLTLIVCAVLIGAAFIGTRYLGCKFRRDFRADDDKRISEIRERIADIEKDEVRDTRALQRLGEQYSHLGGIYIKKGLWDQAIEAYDKSVQFGRRTPGVLYSLGIAHAYRGKESDRAEDIERAESFFKKAIELKDNFYEAQNALAILLFYHRDNREEALSIMKEVASRNPKYYIGRFTLARFYYETGAPEKALQAYEDLDDDLERLPSSSIINEYRNQCRENIQRIMAEMTEKKRD